MPITQTGHADRQFRSMASAGGGRAGWIRNHTANCCCCSRGNELFASNSPDKFNPEAPENEQNNLTKPPLENKYFAYPGHPLYGRQVTVVGRRTTKTEIRCVVEDPARPGFHYQIPARWLSDQPPPENKPVSALEPISLPIASLDRMVQMILTKQSIWRAEEDEPIGQRNGEQHLGTAAGEQQDSAAAKALLPGARTSWRDAP